MRPTPAPFLIALFLALALTACQSTPLAAPDVSGTWSQQSASIEDGCSDTTASIGVELMILQDGTDLDGTLVLVPTSAPENTLSFAGLVSDTGRIWGTATFSNASATPPYSEVVPVQLSLDADRLIGALSISSEACANPTQIVVTLEQA